MGSITQRETIRSPLTVRVSGFMQANLFMWKKHLQSLGKHKHAYSFPYILDTLLYNYCNIVNNAVYRLLNILLILSGV